MNISHGRNMRGGTARFTNISKILQLFHIDFFNPVCLIIYV